MKKLALIAILALIVTASAQINDQGFSREIDDFTGEVSCSHIVLNSRTNTGINVVETGILQLGVYRFNLEADEIVHNMFGASSGDLLYFRFANGDVEELSVAGGEADVDDNARWSSWVSAVIDYDLLNKLVAASEPVRYRIASGGETYDSELPAEVFDPYEGYRERCEG